LRHFRFLLFSLHPFLVLQLLLLHPREFHLLLSLSKEIRRRKSKGRLGVTLQDILSFQLENRFFRQGIE